MITISDSVGPDDGLSEVDLTDDEYDKIKSWIDSLNKTPVYPDPESGRTEIIIGDEKEIRGYNVSVEFFNDGYTVGIRNEDGVVVVRGEELP